MARLAPVWLVKDKESASFAVVSFAPLRPPFQPPFQQAVIRASSYRYHRTCVTVEDYASRISSSRTPAEKHEWYGIPSNKPR